MSPDAPESLGTVLRLARVGKGLSQEAVARELRIPVPLLAAIEADDWPRLPPGRERPLARRVARHLGLDPETYADAWSRVPGGPAQEKPDPQRERLERILMSAMAVGCVLAFLWLVVPGREIKGGLERRPPRAVPGPATPWTAKPAGATPYPVLGELLPEAPLNAEGILVSLRAMDACSAHLVAEGVDLSHHLRVSEPWILRVKGPFTLDLDNAGVVTLEVAGRRIALSGAVGEAWAGRFDAEGRRILPVEPTPNGPLHVPQSEPETPPEV